MAQEWHYTQNGQKAGPITSAQLQALAKSGQIKPTDMVWKEGMAAWTPASKIKGLFPETAVSAKPTPPPVPSAPLKDEPATTSNPAATPPSTKWKWGYYAGGVVALLMLCSGAIRGCADATTGGGTITFAEQVDPATLKTFKESNQFTTGWVWMVVRTKRPVGDTKLIFYGRLEGAVAWNVLGEVTVDPAWDTLVGKELLDRPGRYEIKAMNGKGRLVAQSKVEIVELLKAR